jgi:hypothetical protein
MAIRPVKATCAAVNPPVGTKKSVALTAVPAGVATRIGPDRAVVGTTASSAVVAAAVTSVLGVGAPVNDTRLFVVTGSKFVPLMVTVVPGAAIVGVKLVIVGAPLVAVTVKALLLVADPAGAVTPIVPVVAPAGTETTRLVAVADVTVAAVPLKVTALLAGVELKPVPWMVTTVPTGPVLGWKSMIETVDEAYRVTDSRLPTASY